jgi:hypothetical protein
VPHKLDDPAHQGVHVGRGQQPRRAGRACAWRVNRLRSAPRISEGGAVKFNHVGIPTGQLVIIETKSPSRGVLVALIEVSGAPVELMQIDHQARPDL